MENEQSSAPVDTGSAIDTSNTGDSAEETTAEEQPSSPAESTTAETQGESTGGDGTNVPDEGVDPDTGINPDAGDEATTAEEKQENELKGMSREERAEYFKQQQANQRKQIEEAVNAVYQPQPVEELADYYREQGYDDGQALLLARDDVRNQERQIAEARTQIAELNNFLATEAMDVVNTTPWLDSTKKDQFDEPTANAVSQLYEALAVEKDPNTSQIVNAKMTPKQFYSLMDQVRQSGAKEAAAKARKDAEAEIASVAPPSSTTTVRETPFAELSPAQQREKLIAQGHVF